MPRSFASIVCILAVYAILYSCTGVQVKSATRDTAAYQPRTDAALFEQPAGWQTNAVQNVILMIGDGMGLNHVWLSRVASSGPGGRLNMECMPVSGLVTTYSASNLVTDSAAAATAMATGRKTTNGMIGELPDGTRLKTLLEKAEERRMATGLVVTKAVTDATPAAFSAHNAARDDQSDIAAQILKQGIEVILGGGRKYWQTLAQGGVRTDGRDLIAEAERQGYRSITGAQDLAQVQTTPVLGLLAVNSLAEQGAEPSLAAMTGKAMELLNRAPHGFFLLVEGSQIDTQAHRHDTAEVIRRLLRFDAAVKEALDFAARDGHTLVIVTADHETGGLVVLDGLKEPGVSWATFDHSSTPVALFAYGPGSYNFTGMYDNTEIPIRIARLLGLMPFPEDHPASPKP